ncbi:hypothetical protein U9M48_017699 [Paspalum notatum var. saurae]|uniref:Uncharacterized protein n=1 Tax=Paspalum notatum var. saurae TaxID=547442 RepID=A0AAQ3TA01_PASNO
MKEARGARGEGRQAPDTERSLQRRFRPLLLLLNTACSITGVGSTAGRRIDDVMMRFGAFASNLFGSLERTERMEVCNHLTTGTGNFSIFTSIDTILAQADLTTFQFCQAQVYSMSRPRDYVTAVNAYFMGI